MKRREFLGAVSAAGVSATATASAAEMESSQNELRQQAVTPTETETTGTAATGTNTATGDTTRKPDFGGYLEGVDGGYDDRRGDEEVTVEVGASGNGGNVAFAPAGLWVDTATTIKFEWTGEGGAHNVIAEEGPAELDSGDPVDTEGVEYEYTVENGGITTYFCSPHKAQGMKGAIAVGNDVPTVEVTPTPAEGGVGGAGGEGLSVEELESMGVPFQAHFVGLATILMIIVSLVYTFYVLKYGSSPHASGGNN